MNVLLIYALWLKDLEIERECPPWVKQWNHKDSYKGMREEGVSESDGQIREMHFEYEEKGTSQWMQVN
jgi:hypothetical protein